MPGRQTRMAQHHISARKGSGPRARRARHQPTRAREVSGSRNFKHNGIDSPGPAPRPGGNHASRPIPRHGPAHRQARHRPGHHVHPEPQHAGCGNFRPIINEPQLDDRAPDINLLLEHFKLKQDYCDTFAYTYQEVRTIINQGDRNLVIENIIQKFKELQSQHDFVLCVGTDFLGKDPVFEFELNAEIASNLGCPVMLITSGEGKSAEGVRDSLLVTRDSMAPYPGRHRHHRQPLQPDPRRSRRPERHLCRGRQARPGLRHPGRARPGPRHHARPAEGPERRKCSPVRPISTPWWATTSSPPCTWTTSWATWPRTSSS